MKDLYSESRAETLSKELFQCPPSAYRGAPFWAWNGDLSKMPLNEEIEHMKEMGMGGFFIHPRVGMYTRYLSDAFMDSIKQSVEKAKQIGMTPWLYDEDRYPSGFAGGFVVEKHPEYWQRRLLFTTENLAARPAESDENLYPGPPVLLARYQVELNEEGQLVRYRRLSDSEAADGLVWYAWMEYTAPTARFHQKGYIDTMNPEAVREFLRQTHERYLEVVGDEFGKTIPGIFTDEPQMPRKKALKWSNEPGEAILDYTPSFDETYHAQYGVSFLDTLPEVIWNREDRDVQARYRYHEHCTECFVHAFCDQFSDWCTRHDLYMTGHVLDEPTLGSQCGAVGECMRAYRAFTLPGIDMLQELREYNTLKQASSSVHQYGYPGMVSELYGVTDWIYDFKGYKTHGDWQAALGVTVRVHHHYWGTMHGESKRDYPASIGHQSCWYKEFPFVEDHFARLNTVMTRGKALVRIAVIHPIESYWIAFGPEDQTGIKRKMLDERFAGLTEWLLKNTLDFDFVCESTLPQLYHSTEKGFAVGQMSYDAVILSGCDTLRATTLDALEEFAEKGGKIIWMGKAAAYMDAIPSDRPGELYKRCTAIDWNEDALLKALIPQREVQIADADTGLPSDNLLAALRQDGENRNLFISHCSLPHRLNNGKEEHYRITLKGEWRITCLDTMTGEIRPMNGHYIQGKTILLWNCYDTDSLLLQLTPGRGAEYTANQPKKEAFLQYLPEPFAYTRAEDNVCLLDMAEWRIDDGPWQPEEEMLRIGISAKKQLGLSLLTTQTAQPWFLLDRKPRHTITLRCKFHSDIDIGQVMLGLEDREDCEVLLDDAPVDRTDCGWYTDESVRRLNLGCLSKGDHTLTVTKPFADVTNLENMFLLGDFGVRVTGREIRITALPQTLRFGSWTEQGLPFYSGALTCHFNVNGGKHLKLWLGQFSAPCVTVDVDGKRAGNISLNPCSLDLGMLSPGTHHLDITLWSGRGNTFGALHLSNPEYTSRNGSSWHKTDTEWSYTYHLQPTGLLAEPMITEIIDS